MAKDPEVDGERGGKDGGEDRDEREEGENGDGDETVKLDGKTR